MGHPVRGVLYNMAFILLSKATTKKLCKRDQKPPAHTVETMKVYGVEKTTEDKDKTYQRTFEMWTILYETCVLCFLSSTTFEKPPMYR